MTYFYLIIAAVLIYIIIRITLLTPTEEIKVAFAGRLYDDSTVRKVPRNRNKTIYTKGGEVIDLSKYDRFLIEGSSLEKVGLKSGTKVFTLPLNDNPLYMLCQHFIILKFDNDRTVLEHPDKYKFIDGYKARKAIAIFPTNLTEDDFKQKMHLLLTDDEEISDREQANDRLWKKYSFAILKTRS